MATKPKPKSRHPAIIHSEEQILRAIQAGIPEGGVLWDYLTEIRLERIDGLTEWDRGRAEGVRELAELLQAKASYKGE